MSYLWNSKTVSLPLISMTKRAITHVNQTNQKHIGVCALHAFETANI